MTNQKIDIKSLTSELRNRSRVSDKSLPKTAGEAEAKLDCSDSANTSEESLLSLIKDVNSKNHYVMDRFIYVDADIHEVFNKLKTQTKLKLSYLTSYLLEKFIIEHQEAIKAILSNKQNKFLD